MTDGDGGGEAVEFVDRDLRGARFERVHLTGATFTSTDLTGVTMKGVDLVDVTITGDLRNVVVNGVDVAPLVEAELDARHPGRAEMRPGDADGFRHAWTVVGGLWDETVAHARALEVRDPALLHASVAGEWSFVETLRHLAFASRAWVLRGVVGDLTPWHPLELPWDEAELPGLPRDRAARPTLDEALAVRRDVQEQVRRVLDDLTDERLAETVTPSPEAVWPPAEPFPVATCLLVTLNEEFHHRLYAERDLALLA